MQRDLWLSEEVQNYIDGLKHNPDHGKSPEQNREERKLQKMAEMMIDHIISSREKITDNRLKAIEELVKSSPELIEDLLDDRLTVEAVNGVQSSVKRLMKLSRLEALRIPSGMTNEYLRESVRTYVHGFPQASVVLARAALEQALKDNLDKQHIGGALNLQGLLKEARKWGLLDRMIEQCARDVVAAANAVLHDKPTTDALALDTLVKLRGIVQHLYSVQVSP